MKEKYYSPTKLNRISYVYYSTKHNEYLHIYYTNTDEPDKYCIYEPVDIDKVRKSFTDKYSITDITPNIYNKWHTYFLNIVNKSYKHKKRITKDDYYIYCRRKLLRLIWDDTAYMISKPRNIQLLYDIIDGNIIPDVFRVGRYMLSGNYNHDTIFYSNRNKSFSAYGSKEDVTISQCIDINKLAFSYGYKSFADFKKNEKNNPCYVDYLRKLYNETLKKAIEWCDNNNFSYLINQGRAYTYFPYKDLAFFKPSDIGKYYDDDYDIYYNPLLNTFIYDVCFNKFHDYSYYTSHFSTEQWNAEDELIKMPTFTSPSEILAEIELSEVKQYDNDIMEYCLDNKIYYDKFYNCYGVRTVAEQIMIYNCICNYKRIAYRWLVDRGAKITLTKAEMNDIS